MLSFDETKNGQDVDRLSTNGGGQVELGRTDA